MNLRRAFRELLRNQAVKPKSFSQRKHSFARFETLESRRLLAGVTISGSQVSYLAPAGETNDVTVAEAAGVITFTDMAVPIVAGPGVTVVSAVSPYQVSVPAAGKSQINVTLGDLNDTLDASGITPASGITRMVIQDSSGNDTLVGSGVDDIFIVEIGNDSIDGGGQINGDQLSYSRDSNFMFTDTSVAIGAELDTYVNIETIGINGGPSNNVIDASALTATNGITGVVFNGRDGDDTLIGGATRDIFQDTVGVNSFDGGGGTADAIFFSKDVDMSISDSLVTVAGVSSSHVGIERVDLWGGAGDNVIDASGLTTGSGFTFVHLRGFAGNDTLTGSPFRDTIRVTGGVNVIDGGGDRDTLIAQVDADQILTNTTLEIDSLVSTHTNFEDIRLNGGNSDNLLDASGLDASSGVDYVAIQGLDGNDTLLGSQVFDEIRSQGGNNFIDGGGSPMGTRDRLVFFQDEDVTATDASIVVGSGVNTVSGIEDLRLVGKGGDNVFDASELTIGSGINVLVVSGQGGDDTLRPSSDTAITQNMDGSGGNDQLDLSHLTIVPAINFSGPGSIDGDAGSYTLGGPYTAFNNINAITLPAVYDFTLANYSSVEGAASNVVTNVQITRSVNTDIASSVNVVLTSGTATAGDDFAAGPITVNFLPGQVTASVPIEILGEDIVELDESFTLSFANGISGTSLPAATYSITNDDSATISINDVTQVETDSGQTAFVFEATLSAPVDVAVDLQADTADNTATVADADYDAIVAGGVSFSASTSGAQTQTITVLVNGDINSESDEAFWLNLSSVVAAGRDVTLADAQGLGTIQNDDVSNLPPELASLEVTATLAEKASPGDLVSLTAEFTDANPGDTHTATIDWGDGTLTAGVITSGTIVGDHTYATGGLFDVQVTVDDGTAAATGVVVAVVSGVRLTDNGELQIVGTDARDHVHLKKRSHDRIRVETRFGHGPKIRETFLLGDVQAIRIVTCQGNDHITIDHRLDVDATIDAGDGRDFVRSGSGNDTIRGGAGNDILFAGSGDDIVLGGSGRDLIFGGSGRDILIGGLGRDLIFGGSGEDILIGDSTIHDDDEAALLAIRAEWTSNKSIAVRKQNLIDGTGDGAPANGSYFLDAASLIDHNELDLLIGGWGTDWLPELE